MNQKEKQEQQTRRFAPLELVTITRIYRAIKNDSGIAEQFGKEQIELALTVSLQLQQYARLAPLEQELREERNKSIGDKLREMADTLDEY